MRGLPLFILAQSMSLEAIQQKKQFIESRSRIREFVFGIQDGLISTVGLLAGMQGATENNLVVIITGLTAMFSGAISMATGSYLSSGAQKDIFDKELNDAERLAASEPYIAAEGLLKALGDEGLSKAQSYRMVKVLLAERNVFMRTFQEKVFGLIGLDLEVARERFGHMLEAFTYGAPPHGGIAPGIDRLVMLLAGEPNIREVMALPKSQNAADLMVGAPSEVEDQQLEELHIRVVEKRATKAAKNQDQDKETVKAEA